MRFPPAEVMLSWPKPNYENPVTRGSALMAVELTLLPLALICVALRLWVRIAWLKKSWWDDWLMVVAAIWSCGTTTLVILATQLYGWNAHVWDVPLAKLQQGRQASMAGQTLFVLASSFVKMSILVSYFRIAPEKSFFRKAVWGTLVLVFTAMAVFLVALWTQCMPIRSYWNLMSGHKDCIDEGPPLVVQTVVNVVTDFMIYVLPMPTLFALKLPTSQRVGLMVLFGFGGIIVIAGSFRAYWVHFVLFRTFDVTWEGFQIWVWTAVETNVGVICGCIPTLRPLLYRSRSRMASQRSYGSGTGRKPPMPMNNTKEVELESHALTSDDPQSAPPVYKASTTRSIMSDASKSSIDGHYATPWENQNHRGNFI